MLDQLFQVTDTLTRSISPENPTGEPGKGGMCPLEEGTCARAARDLGTGWKINPYIFIEPKSTVELAHIDGSGVINQIWVTISKNWRWRSAILRFYWDGSDQPSVECPLGDFFCMGWNEFSQINSLAVCINPGSGFNCYWRMPFKKGCRITLENISEERVTIYYQINYELRELPDEIAYFHAQFRRVNPLPYKEVYTIVDGIEGKGQYVGTYMAWGVHSSGWWGEGEIKFYIDDDDDYPTICGTGTEDYFGGSFDFRDPADLNRYATYSTPYSGMHVFKPDGAYRSQTRFGLYRWHITDPVHFSKNLRVTIQALGWREGGRYLPLQDDLASVAFWYQTLPTKKFPALPDKDSLEVI